ncbi:hypothetical protein PTI98_009577 [Pleurotus ostreatus]|nr:hypothetical protein PTI98_009577 [Pleurotus ostreatus]
MQCILSSLDRWCSRVLWEYVADFNDNRPAHLSFVCLVPGVSAAGNDDELLGIGFYEWLCYGSAWGHGNDAGHHSDELVVSQHHASASIPAGNAVNHCLKNITWMRQ